MICLPNKDDFIKKLEFEKMEARSIGKQFIDILSAELHKRVGGYPSKNHRMATC